MGLYATFRKLLSKKNQGRVTRFLIISGFKPKINRKVVSFLKTGVIVFSADFEMAWAFRYSKTRRTIAREMGLKERTNVPLLLGLFDKYQIPVTWATVGHLFLNGCERNEKSLAHYNMPRPAYFENINWNFSRGDWYDNDPCSDYLTEPAWYAPDLIEQILNAKVKHEIGCHTFSHTDFTYKNCTPELASAEIDACTKLASEKGLNLKSMVFPGGTLGNFDILKERGFICYRKPMQYHLDLPFEDAYGLIAIPSSLGLDMDPYGWSVEFHLNMIRKYLERTAKHKLVCHFWFHPSMVDWYLENVFPKILNMVDEFRASGKIVVNTMQELAETYIKDIR
jgi:peptidoglycan/xylan/chitin deacetylase (PgdA/CDA1 family)